MVARVVAETRVTKNPQPGLVHRGCCGRHRNPLYWFWLKKNIHDGYAFVNGIVQDFSRALGIFVQSTQGIFHPELLIFLRKKV